jgi:hypothetical protein
LYVAEELKELLAPALRWSIVIAPLMILFLKPVVVPGEPDAANTAA